MSEPFCIDAKLMGTERHLHVDDGYKWVEEIPTAAWHLSGELKHSSNRCLDTVMKLNSKEADLLPHEKYLKMMQVVAPDHGPQQLPWVHLMTSKEHRSYVRKLINEAVDTIDNYSKDYYVSTWVNETAVLDALKPAMVSRKRYAELKATVKNNVHTIESFEPNLSGYAAPVLYDRLATRTGRLTVKSGPQILTLKREHRDLVVPSTPNGKIMYVDFAALEARVLLYEAGGQCSDVDLYRMIARDLFGDTVSRDAVKLAVISELYGSGKHTLGETLQISGDPLDRFIAKIKGFFKTNDLKARVKDQYVKLGYIRNRHGRMVKIDEPIDRIFVNSYAQSTGVDVSLLGFNELLKSLKHTKCRPLFVLHDALIIDVPEESVDEVMQIESVKVPGYVQSFKLKVQMM